MSGDFFLTQWAFLGMRWLYETLTNESIVWTVIIATLIIRCATIFSDIRSRKTSMKMQLIQPQLQRIQKKYANDPQRLSIEQRKLMKDNDVSMFGGCLPMLFTLPIFFIFIAAFRQWGNEMQVKLIVEMDADPVKGVEFFRNFKFLWVNNMWAADNGFKPVVMQASEFFSAAMKNIPDLLYFKENPEALATFVRLGFFTETDGVYALATLTEEVAARYNELLKPCMDLYAGYNNGWFVFPILAAATTFFSSWFMMKGQNQNNADADGKSNPADAAKSTGKMMTWLMPLMSFYFCLISNATFALYWTASNVFSTISALILNRHFAKTVPVPAEVKEK